MIVELFIQAASGESIVWKKYSHGVSVNTRQVFYELAKKHKEISLPPHVEEGGYHYFHIKRQSLFLVAVTNAEHLPVFIIELLSKLFQLLKDFCGAVNEASLKANIVLVYEVLEEVLDTGLVQLCSTERLKPYIQSEPVPIRNEHSTDVLSPNLFGVEQRSVPGTAADKPVIRSRWDNEARKNEIFVDVIERITAVVAPNGSVVRCEAAGQVNMKSFLMGSPDIKVGLNEDLTIGKEERRRGYGGMVHLDDCTFHECIKLDEFSDAKILTVRPPEGEFTLMTYHLHGDLPHGLPFRLQTYISDNHDARDVELNLSLRCDISSSCHAVNVSISLPLPKSTTGISQRLSGPGQTATFVYTEKRLLWKIKKIYGKSEVSGNFKLFQPTPSTTKHIQEIGPAVLDFEISGITPSNLQIRFLRVFDREHSYVPMRWLRYVTTTDSYIFKL